MKISKIFGACGKIAYICNVFFIVLDLRLTKEGAAVPIFFYKNDEKLYFYFFVRMDKRTYHATMMAMPAMPKNANNGMHESRNR